jgi:hypothetical protein
MGYQLEGRLLEVCNCGVLCPCWVGEAPDNGTCDSIVAWRIDNGNVDGVDVSDRTFAILAFLPGTPLDGNWRVVACLDDRATPEQEAAILGVWTGQRGGPVADLAQLIGEVVAVERAPITFTVEDGKGTLKIGELADCELAPFVGATGLTTSLSESVFSTIPGSPAYVGKATKYERRVARYGLADISLEGRNAIQGYFKFEAS